MNVLHAPFNIGSQASSLSDAENAVRREAGSRGLSWSVDFEPGSRYSAATEVFRAPDGWAGTLHRAFAASPVRAAARGRVPHAAPLQRPEPDGAARGDSGSWTAAIFHSGKALGKTIS